MSSSNKSQDSKTTDAAEKLMKEEKLWKEIRGDFDRPQVPVSFDYSVEEVSFRNTTDNILLSGTLSVPKGSDPFKCVILLPGSLQADRDGENPNRIEKSPHKYLLVLSDYLSKNGIATFRYDKRGCGESEGNYNEITINNLAEDGVFAFEFLSKNPKLSHLGVAGHSEGGLIAPIIVNKSKHSSFIISMAAPSLPLIKVCVDQKHQQYIDTGISKDGVHLLNETDSDLLQATIDLPDTDELIKKIQEISERYKQLSKKDLRILCWDGTEKVVKETLDELTAPYFRSSLLHNSFKELEKIRIPYLAIHGTNDQLVRVENLHEIKSVMENSGNTNYTIHEFNNLNHGFQTCKTDDPLETERCEESFNEDAMELIANWILEKSM
tara:strand:+ start:165 stop:1307 length:1143 start_codon:yes stop_codon:yes gene_type:complete